MSFSPRGQTIATVSADKTLRLWDVATGGELANFDEAHSEPINSVAFAPNGRQLATAASDRTLGLWSAMLPRVFASRTLAISPSNAAAVSSDGKVLASVGDKYAVLIHDATTGAIRHTLKGHRGVIVQLAFSPDGKWLVSVGRDRLGIVWDTSTGQRYALLDGHRGFVRAVAFSADGKQFATAGSDRRILVYDTPTTATPTDLREKTQSRGA